MTMSSDVRSGYDPNNLPALLQAGSAHSVLNAGQAQYSTPPHWARFFAGLLPGTPGDVLDPQCAAGHLLRDFPFSTLRLGIELDRRMAEHREVAPGMAIQRITGNCVKVWQLLDELYPDLRFTCQCVNPPFSLRWKVDAGVGGKETHADSTAHTWRNVERRAATDGYGYFIASRAALEAIGLPTHPWAYLVQWFPAGLFPGVSIEIGVVHWHNSPRRFRHRLGPTLVLPYTQCDANEHGFLLEEIRAWHRTHVPTRAHLRAEELEAAWTALGNMIREEERGLPPFNVFLDPKGALRLHFGTRFQIQRKLTPEDVVRLSKVDGCHPLALTQEVETRKLLRELLAEGFTVQPSAREAIDAALRAVDSIALPIMPVTDFEKVAYVDELEHLVVRADFPAKQYARKGLHFTPGQSYPLTTASYTFTEKFTRQRAHYNETEGTHILTHHCELSGQDRYVAVTDDQGQEHRFMDRPKKPNPEAAKPAPAGPSPNRHSKLAPRNSTPQPPMEHAETLLWQIFMEPEIRTIAEVLPDLVADNLRRLLELAASVTH